MEEYSEEIDTRNLRVEPCPNCGKTPIIEVARAESLLFGGINYYLLRCSNEVCNTHAWCSIHHRKEDITPEILFVSKKPSLSAQSSTELKVSAKSYEEVPAGLVSDFDQAYQCLLSKFYEAACCLARRTLERALIDKGANPKLRPIGMIEELARKGIIPNELKLILEDVRYYGNLSAHPSELIDKKGADSTLLFVDIMIT